MLRALCIQEYALLCAYSSSHGAGWGCIFLGPWVSKQLVPLKSNVYPTLQNYQGGLSSKSHLDVGVCSFPESSAFRRRVAPRWVEFFPSPLSTFLRDSPLPILSYPRIASLAPEFNLPLVPKVTSSLIDCTNGGGTFRARLGSEWRAIQKEVPTYTLDRNRVAMRLFSSIFAMHIQ